MAFDDPGKEAVESFTQNCWEGFCTFRRDTAPLSVVMTATFCLTFTTVSSTCLTIKNKRLAAESHALAPTYFDAMTFLFGLLLVEFSLGIIATAAEADVHSEAARVLFAVLVVCYTSFTKWYGI